MKIIEALKQIKDLKIKADDLKTKVSQNCALTSIETPLYPDQKSQVSEWIQAHSDILKEISRLALAIQRTNIATQVTIELGGKQVTKSIAEWIFRRRDLAKAELDIWSALTDRNIRESSEAQTSAGNRLEIKIVRFYDPKQRDEKKSLFSSEPSIIDGKLEIVNAVTDLIE